MGKSCVLTKSGNSKLTNYYCLRFEIRDLAITKSMSSCFDINMEISESGDDSIIYRERNEMHQLQTSSQDMEPRPTGTTTNNLNVYLLNNDKQRAYYNEVCRTLNSWMVFERETQRACDGACRWALTIRRPLDNVLNW